MLIILWEDGRGIYITVFTVRMQKHVSACKITCMRLFSISDSILADKVSGFDRARVQLATALEHMPLNRPRHRFVWICVGCCLAVEEWYFDGASSLWLDSRATP